MAQEPDPSAPSRRAAAFHRPLLIGSWLGLLVLLCAPLAVSNRASTGLWLMQCIPLLLTLPGLLRGHGRTLQWLCFLVLFIFTQAILQLFSTEPAMRWIGALTTLFCVLLFTTAIVSLRGKVLPKAGKGT